MAGAARYTALLDANVLFPKLQCDALLSLAHAVSMQPNGASTSSASGWFPDLPSFRARRRPRCNKPKR